jgi:flavin reductase (DIM6/NTAB) family NADH-FMN oxidoreductase RutF
MQRKPIIIDQFVSRPFHLFDQRWLLLTSGDFSTGEYNCMTISWGSFGFMWGYPFAQTVVRPVRYTFSFMERFPTFTLCAFPRQYRRVMDVLGTKSGRDGDKVGESGLTLAASTRVAAPCYEEAELVIECQKIYWSDIDPSHFIDPALNQHYPSRDYHRSYIGKILAISGSDTYAVEA